MSEARGAPRGETPATLICALLFRDEGARKAALHRLESSFGPFGTRLSPFPFNHTRYYEKEMGPDLLKEMVSFRDLCPPSFLPRIKRITGAIEVELRDGDEAGRTVNLDPGYIVAPRLVLASTKDHAHRIYLDRGIFGEVTLIFRDGGFQPLPWTYPDYQEPSVKEFLETVRSNYMERLKAAGAGGRY